MTALVFNGVDFLVGRPVGPEEGGGTLSGGGILLERGILPGVETLAGGGGGGFVPGVIGSCG